MSFQALLADLEALSAGSANEGGEDVTKSMAEGGEAAGGDEGGEDDGEAGGDADDAAIAAAAADGEAAGEAADGGDDEGDALGKSLTFTDADGNEQEGVDATDLIKSLVERVGGIESDTGKAIGLLTDLVKSQATQIGALSGQVTKLAAAGRGRRAVVNVADKPELTKALGGEGGEGGDEPQGIPANEFMAKAMDACTAGKITGLDVARCESYLNRGLDIPASIKTKVLGA